MKNLFVSQKAVGTKVPARNAVVLLILLTLIFMCFCPVRAQMQCATANILHADTSATFMINNPDQLDTVEFWSRLVLDSNKYLIVASTNQIFPEIIPCNLTLYRGNCNNLQLAPSITQREPYAIGIEYENAIVAETLFIKLSFSLSSTDSAFFMISVYEPKSKEWTSDSCPPEPDNCEKIRNHDFLHYPDDGTLNWDASPFKNKYVCGWLAAWGSPSFDFSNSHTADMWYHPIAFKGEAIYQYIDDPGDPDDQPLIQGKMYCLSFKYRAGTNTTGLYPLDTLKVLISNDLLGPGLDIGGEYQHYMFNYQPIAIITNIHNSSSWTSYSINFVANNNYQNICIFPLQVRHVNATDGYHFIAVDSVKIYTLDFEIIQANGHCAYDSIRLSAKHDCDSIVGYTWSTTPVSHAPQISVPAVNATYTVTITLQSGCTASEDITVEPFDPFEVNISGNDSICKGQSATLIASTNNSGNCTYTWSPCAAPPCNSQTMIVTPSIPTVYTLTANCDGCTASNSISVNFFPDPNKPELQGPFHNCNTNAQYYLDSIQPGVNYFWSFPPDIGYFVPTGNNSYTGTGPVNVVWDSAFSHPHFGFFVIAEDAVTGCSNSDTIMVYQCCKASSSTHSNYINWMDSTVVQPLNVINKEIYVNGTITLKENGMFTDCRFHMGPDSKILIGNYDPGLKTVSIRNSDLFSCDNLHMWDGLYITNEFKTLMITNSYIQDAQNAIVSEWGGGYMIQTDTFNLNWKSLVIRGENKVFSPTCSFYKNKVICTDINQMLYPYNNKRSYIGVEVIMGHNINIGTDNEFINLGIGIYSFASSVNISRNMFANIQQLPWQYTKSAILAVGGSNTHGISISNNIFKNCLEGIIITEPTDIKIDKNEFTNISRNAIYYRWLYGNTVRIDNNNITNASTGIFAYMPGKSNSVISNNKISWTNTLGGIGIKFFGSRSQKEKVTIGFSNEISMTKAGKGIWVIDAMQPLLDNNIIRLKNCSPYPKAIHIQDCYSPRITNNKIRATNTPSLMLSSYGVSFELSENTSVICNEIDKTGTAINAAGCCIMTGVLNNSMSNGTYGLTLANGGIIDQQGDWNYPSDNNWYNIQNDTWSFHSYGDQSSLYVRNTNNVNPEIHTNDLTGNPLYFSAFGRKSPATGDQRLCINIMPSFNDSLLQLKQIALRQATYFQNDVAAKYLAERSVRTIVQYDSLAQTDHLLINYFNSTKTMNMGLLDSALHALRNGDYLTASALNNLVADTNLMDANEKMVNIIELNHAADKSDLTQQEIDELRNLAIKCPFTDGKAVFRARILLAAADSFNTEYINVCEQPLFIYLRNTNDIDSSEMNNAAQFKAYPNPSNGTINFSWSDDLKEPKINLILFNMLGQSVLSAEIMTNNNEISINIDELNNGMYFYLIKNENEVLSSGKVILKKL